MRFLSIFTTILFFSLMFSCATGSSIVTGTVRPAISPTEVKIYLEPPSQYETIGLVEASSDVELSTQAAQDRVINELKKQAAKLGANGVLLINSGIFYAGSSETKTAQGKAIYVIKK